MTAPDVLAGRLRLLADRLDDGYRTFAGKIVTEELREAAALLDGTVRVEYGHEWVNPHPNDPVIPWSNTFRDAWPANERGPWAITQINNLPVNVVRRTIITGPWVESPQPEGDRPGVES